MCIDCGTKLKNRSKSTLRCWDCRKKFLSASAAGRKTGTCITCGTKLSQIKNTTGKCKTCFLKDQIIWNKGVPGQIPWNKGKSIFESKESYRLHSNEMRKTTRKNNLHQCISDRMRTLIRNSLRLANSRKINSKTAELLGCSIDFFMGYISDQFEQNMTWENYGNGHGKWNIDHIIPTSSFNLFEELEQKRAFHFSNCRPMWAIENVKKGAKMPLNRKQTQIILPMLTTTVTI
jgi:DNA-directed RNA polymerase subunit RPC12/RpoP